MATPIQKALNTITVLSYISYIKMDYFSQGLGMKNIGRVPQL
jgi:hypothetical protein